MLLKSGLLLREGMMDVDGWNVANDVNEADHRELLL
jgi:hypothetical protein